jgi:hypothetical protein
LCDLPACGLERKNFDVNGKRIKNLITKKTSKYINVSFNKKQSKWLASKKCETELEAAIKADEICEELGLEPQNFSKKDRIQLKTKNTHENDTKEQGSLNKLKRKGSTFSNLFNDPAILNLPFFFSLSSSKINF